MYKKVKRREVVAKAVKIMSQKIKWSKKLRSLIRERGNK